MTLIEMYKAKVYDTLQMIYNNQIKPEKLRNYIDNLCKNIDVNSIQANARNLYTYENEQTFDPNEIPNMVKENQLNILSNGLYTLNFDPPSSDIMAQWMAARKEYKKKKLEALEANDMEMCRVYDNKQLKVKQNTNSMYGASTMPCSYISNVDIGGAITAQSRNFISEQQWAIERFIASNMVFDDMDEALNWVSELFKIKGDNLDPEMMKYMDYIPTSEDCRHRFTELARTMDSFRKQSIEISKSLFLMFDFMSETRRIIFYYANNPVALMSLNPKIKALMKEFINNGVSFINPYKIPDEIKDSIELLSKIIKYFSFSVISVYNRVVKYQTRNRRCCILSDTDSTMPTMNKIVEDTLKMVNQFDLIDNEDIVQKLSMFYVYIISALLDDTCNNFATDCNGRHIDKPFLLNMKNEFFFSKVLIFNVKKNYVAICELQEGRVVPKEKQLAITGSLLGASKVHEYVAETVGDIIENKVLRSPKYNPLDVLHSVNTMSDHIRKSILSGDKTFGMYARYNGINNLKDPERTGVARAAMIWNYIYKDDVLSPGDAVYQFDTTLVSEDDLNRIPDKYNDIKELIRNNVFRKNDLGFDFSRFGLKLFAIPADGEHKTIPEWIIPFIDVESMVTKHIHPIVSLYGSLLLSPTKHVDRNSSVKKMSSSNLIRF